MPAAQAMDYVKCEAMQKAMTRVRSNGELAKENAGYAWDDEISEKFCGPRPPGYGTKETRAHLICSMNAQKQKRATGDKIRAMNAAYAEATKDLTKIQADYEAEGCY